MANAVPVRDSKADAARRKKQRRSAHKDKEYLAFVARFPCCACGNGRVEVHHEPPRSHAGEWHDRKTVPLCAECHRGWNGRHLLGKEGFEEFHGLILEDEIRRLNKLYEGEQYGN